MDDGEPLGDQWRLPPGAPIRISDWVALPIVYLCIGVIDLAVHWGRMARAPIWWAVTSPAYAALVVVSSMVLAVCGYWAYHSLTERSIIRFRIVGVLATVLVGVRLSVSPFLGTFLLAVAGYQLASLNVRIVERAQLALTDSVWRQIAIVAAVLTLVGPLVRPLTAGVGYQPLIVINAVLTILCPVTAGFAYQTRKVNVEHSH